MVMQQWQLNLKFENYSGFGKIKIQRYIQQKYNVIKSGHMQTDEYAAYDDLVSSLFWQNTNGYG